MLDDSGILELNLSRFEAILDPAPSCVCLPAMLWLAVSAGPRVTRESVPSSSRNSLGSPLLLALGYITQACLPCGLPNVKDLQAAGQTFSRLS